MKKIKEKIIYKSNFHYWINQILFPLKMIIPQPIVAKIPFLTTNEDIRIGISKALIRGRLLDIGCGKNKLVQEFRSNGGFALGVDVYDWGTVDCIVSNTASLPYDAGSFDTITFVASLNHIPNRRDVLLEARRLLSIDGRILITNLNPFISFLWHTYAYWDADQHERGMVEGEVYGFKMHELESLLYECELKIEDVLKFSWGLNRILICSKF